MPESSARVGIFVIEYKAFDFSAAFSSNVLPVSSTSQDKPNISGVAISIPNGDTICLNSLYFFLLFVESKIFNFFY